MGDVPAVKQWIGSKVYQGLKTYSYSIKNLDWYDGFNVAKSAIRRQTLDFIGPRIAMLVSNMQTFKADRVIVKLIAGTSGLAHDGIAFFSDASGVRTNDNLVTGSGVSLANLKTDIAATRLLAMNAVSDKSKKLRIRLDTIVCSVAMEDLFLQIKNSTSDPTASQSGVANVTGGHFSNIIALPELDSEDAYDWYFMATRMPLKPFIYQSEPLENGQEVLPVVDSSKLESDGVIGFSAEHAGEAGYGLPELAYKITNT